MLQALFSSGHMLLGIMGCSCSRIMVICGASHSSLGGDIFFDCT